MRSSTDVFKDAAAASDRQAAVLAARRQNSAAAQSEVTEVAVQPALAPGQKMKTLSICRRVGHGSRYSGVLLLRPDWKLVVCEKWFMDDKQNQYYRPQHSILVDFSDEMHFSRMAMYIKGRQHLENKSHLAMLVPNLMPETFHIRDMQWLDNCSPKVQDGDTLPWFIKEAEGNEGTFVDCCPKADDCMKSARPGINYVVQEHVNDALMYEGRKFHLRLHMLITCKDDGMTWRAYTYKDGYLNISPNPWAPGDISRDTQVVIFRSQRIAAWEPWHDIYPRCRASMAEVLEKAVVQGKLEGRLGKEQFEICSSDYMVDTHGKVWLLEVNMGPVLRDSELDPECHDDQMIHDAFEIIYPREDLPNMGQWDFIGEFIGVSPVPPESSTVVQ